MAATIWKGHLTFGLVSIPIKLVRAARAEKIHMHRLERSTGARVRQVFVPAVEATTQPPDEGTEPEPTEAFTPPPSRNTVKVGPSLVAARRTEPEPAPVPFPAEPLQPQEQRVAPSQMVKGYEFEKNKFVTFESEELERLAPKSSSDMQIVEFVRLAEVDPVYLESSYYVAPDRGGEKPYSLLFEALQKTGYAAIAEFVMHRRDQTIILRTSTGGGGLIAHTLFYEDEIRRENAFPPNAELVSGKELDLAVKLVEALSAPFDATKFKDKFRERLQQAIAAKVESGTISTPARKEIKAAPVVDIMAALRESLQAARKPAASESTPQAAAKTKAQGSAAKKARSAH